MRIALSFPGCHRRGGVERVILECANYLADHGHEVHLFACEWDDDHLHAAVHRHGVVISESWPLARARQFPTRCRQAMTASKLAFDVHGGFGVMSPPGAVTWVQSVHAEWLAISRQQRRGLSRIRQKLNPFHRLILQRERAVFGGQAYGRLIALTERVKRELIEHYGVPDADVDVLPNGFSAEEFNIERRSRERDAVRRQLSIPPDAKVVIFVANETERKGFGPLLRAIGRLNDPRVHLLAVGRLNLEPYRSEIAQLGLSARTHHVGPTSEVGRFYAAADVFALPTVYEAWGLVIVEAMASGLPVLTSRLAGASAAVREGETGQLLDDPRSVEEVAVKLERLIAGDHAQSGAISESVQEYRWTEVLRSYEQTLVKYGCPELLTKVG